MSDLFLLFVGITSSILLYKTGLSVYNWQYWIFLILVYFSYLFGKASNLKK